MSLTAFRKKKRKEYSSDKPAERWKQKISSFFDRTEKEPKEDKLSFFLTSLLSRPYRPHHIHLSFFLPEGHVEGTYGALMKDLNERDQTYLQHILTDVLKTGKHFQIALTTLSNYPICLYGFAVGRGYLLFSYPLSEKLEELDAERHLSKITRQKLQTLETYCNILPFPFWCRDTQQNIIFSNQAYRTIAGDSDGEIFHKAKAQILAKSALLRGKEQKMEISAAYGGKRYDYNVTEIPFYDSEDHAFTVGTAKDITEECALKKQNKRLQTSQNDILQNLSIAAILFDSKRRILYYNKAFLDVWGLTEEELEQTPDHPSLLETLQLKRKLPESRDIKEWRAEQFAPYSDINEVYRQQWHLPDGRIMDVISSAYGAGGLVSLYDDVTEKIRLEKIYQNSVNNLQETLDSLPFDIALFNAEGRLKVFNKSMDELSSQPLYENIYLSEFQDYLKDYPQYYNFFTHVIEAAHSLFPEEGLDITRDEGEKTVRLQAVRLESSDIMVTFRDVTAQTAYEKILSDRTAAVKQLSQIREMLFRQVSYQLREPMTAISGFSEVLESEIFGTLNAKQKEYISDMRGAADQMLELIDNLRDLVSLSEDAEDFQKDFKENDLMDIVKSAVKNVQNKLKEKNIALNLEANIVKFYLYCDFTSLRQALMQLLYNAIDASHEGDVILLKVTIDEQEVSISIQDKGIGLDQDGIHIIEKGHHSGQMKGYGLLYVKRVCDLHHAKLCHISDYKEGAEMRITLQI